MEQKTETFAVGRCWHCGQRAELTLPVELARKVNAWRFNNNPNKPLIQVALPELDADQREMILTGLHAKCWEEVIQYDVNSEEDDE